MDQSETQWQKHSLLLEELSIRHEALNEDVSALLEELQVTKTQLSACLSDSKYFSAEEWKTIEAEKKMLEEKLLRDMANIRDPRKAKETYKNRNVQSHWLFVR